MGILDVLLAVLYPPACAHCHRPLRRAGPARFCPPCRRSLGVVVAPCARCAEPGAAPLCETCAASPPAFGRAYALFPYRDGAVLAEALARWKYRGRADVGAALARLFAEEAPLLPSCYDVVVPVPLHPSKLGRRGFNQAGLLARALCRVRPATGRLAPTALRRRRTRAQARLARGGRRANVRDAFRAPADLPGARVLLVDDVLTTGATVDACARELRRARAESVDVLVLARTPRPESRR